MVVEYIKLIHMKGFVLCLHAEIISFLELSKFLLKYFNVHIFSSKQKLHPPCKLFVEEDLFIIFQFMTIYFSIDNRC